MKTLLRFFVIVLLCSLVLVQYAASPTPYAKETIQRNLAELDQQSTISLDFNTTVYSHIRQVIKREKSKSERLLGLGEMYFPVIENVLENAGLPDELKYLTVVESSLNPNAVSPAGATGMWQFMKSTARLFGLRVDSKVDERRDYYESTKAAVRFLTDLNHRYNDWLLALAAYNCGPGNVSKAIRRSGGKRDFWSIRKYLPRETQHYVPRFIAETYVLSYHNLYGYMPELIDNDIAFSHTLIIKEGTNIDQFVRGFNINLGDFYLLNPEVLKHKNSGEPYEVRMPIPEDTDQMTRLEVYKTQSLDPELSVYKFPSDHKKEKEAFVPAVKIISKKVESIPSFDEEMELEEKQLFSVEEYLEMIKLF